MRSQRALALVAIIGALGLAACGGDNKPQYCSDRSNLEQAVKDLGNVNVLQSGGPAQLRSQLQKVESDAQQLAGSAKSDFPSESSAIQSSVAKLKADLQSLPSSPTTQQLVSVASDVKAVVTATQSFVQATKSKCS